MLELETKGRRVNSPGSGQNIGIDNLNAVVEEVVDAQIEMEMPKESLFYTNTSCSIAGCTLRRKQ